MKAFPFLFILVFLFVSCKNESTKQIPSDETKEYEKPILSITSNPKGEKIIDLLEEEAAGKIRETAAVLYQYNNQNYRIERNCGWYEFKQDLSESGSNEVIKIDNIEVVQFINDRPRRDLADSTKFRLTKNLRKKLFFLELPFGLNSPTVQKKFLKSEEIKGKRLAKVKVEFIEDNYDQTYLVEAVFWVDEVTDRIAYLSVRFGEEDKKVEFLKPINERKIEDVLFMDYQVYRPRKNKDFALIDLASAYENGKLDKIDTKKYQHIQVSLSENKCD